MATIVISSFFICFAIQLTLVKPALSSNLQECPFVSANEASVKILGSKCYIFHPSTLRSHDQADLTCRVSGATLAQPKTEEINTFLAKQMENYDMSSTWIGLEQSIFALNSEYEWSDGSPVIYKNFHPSSVPSVISSCFSMNDHGYWFERECVNFGFSATLNHRPFICEVARDMTPVTKSDDDSKADDTDRGDIPEVDDGSETQKDDEAKDEGGEKTAGKSRDAQEKGDEQGAQNSDNEKEVEDLANPRKDDPDSNDPDKEDPDSKDSDKEDPDSKDSEKEDPNSNESEIKDPDSNDPGEHDPDSESDGNNETEEDKDGQVHRCHFECHLDCRMAGYLKDSVTGCAICECDEA